MEIKERLSKSDIASIKPGEKRIFLFKSYKAILSARSYICQMTKSDPPSGIAMYRTKSDSKSNSMVVEAVPV
jgi:hypothetical protein